MQLTEEMWSLLIDRITAIEHKLDEINQVRLWKARITGAVSVIAVLVIPLLIEYARRHF